MLEILKKLLPTIDGGIILKDISQEQNNIVVQLMTVNVSCTCPICNNSCNRIHSKYDRWIADLPWSCFAVKIKLTTRKFFCDNENCIRKIFTERFKEDLVPYARRTNRLKYILEEIGFATGANAGSLLSENLKISVSSSTLLRIIHHSSVAEFETPKVLGVDDWAFKKGNHYGTILVDLEKRQPIDLLPDRTAETLKDWLKKHPGVEIITRDRSGSYALGAKQGAPKAIQVADRWHLLKNLGDAIKKMLDKNNVELKKTAKLLAESSCLKTETEEEHANVFNGLPKDGPIARKEITKEKSLFISTQEFKFLEVKRLRKEGYSIRSIHRQTGVHRQIIKKYFKYDEYPCNKIRRRTKTEIYKYEDFIRNEWEGGERNKAELWRKITSQGYRGSIGSFYRFTKKYPSDTEIEKLPEPLKITVWSARKVSVLISQKIEILKEEEQNFLRTLYKRSPEIKQASQLVRRFKKMTDELSKKKLDGWINDAKECQASAMKTFANGLQRDYDAVKAAVSLKWSNGQVEGQVNRLKNIKRQMYGRAGFELLKKKVLMQTG
jgi:transposase